MGIRGHQGPGAAGRRGGSESLLRGGVCRQPVPGMGLLTQVGPHLPSERLRSHLPPHVGHRMAHLVGSERRWREAACLLACCSFPVELESVARTAEAEAGAGAGNWLEEGFRTGGRCIYLLSEHELPGILGATWSRTAHEQQVRLGIKYHHMFPRGVRGVDLLLLLHCHLWVRR